MINKKNVEEKMEDHLIQRITQQIVRYLFSQYLNTSDQPIGFQWNQFDEIMISFCTTYFIKSFDKITDEEKSHILNIISISAREECLKVVNASNIHKLPVRQIRDEIDLLNSIFFDCTVSLLNYNYHKDYFSKFFEYNMLSKTPSIDKYLKSNRENLQSKATKRLESLTKMFNLDDSDTLLLSRKVNKYYHASLS